MSESAGESSSASKSNKKTKAEEAFRARREAIEKDRIRKRATLNHKEKVEKFNSYLNTLSEHYDIPKVSWTKWSSGFTDQNRYYSYIYIHHTYITVIYFHSSY